MFPGGEEGVLDGVSWKEGVWKGLLCSGIASIPLASRSVLGSKSCNFISKELVKMKEINKRFCYLFF